MSLSDCAHRDALSSKHMLDSPLSAQPRSRIGQHKSHTDWTAGLAERLGTGRRARSHFIR